MQVRSLASLIGLRIQRCHRLQGSSQMWLRSGVAVAVAVAPSYSSYWTPRLGTSIHCSMALKRKKVRKKKYKCLAQPHNLPSESLRAKLSGVLKLSQMTLMGGQLKATAQVCCSMPSSNELEQELRRTVSKRKSPSLAGPRGGQPAGGMVICMPPGSATRAHTSSLGMTGFQWSPEAQLCRQPLGLASGDPRAGLLGHTTSCVALSKSPSTQGYSFSMYERQEGVF